MYPLLRPFLFRLEPERAHTLTITLLRLAGALSPACYLLRAIYAPPSHPVSAFGLNFTNPVGLAAGYDKDGLAWRALACLGFGHIEVGTVTLRPQSGNPRPRLFRLQEDRALVNWMGFPGRGADFVSRRLRSRRPVGLIIGINLGKNRDTPLECAAGDYLNLMQAFAAQADYLAINVSSPNTEGLRRLQARTALSDLLSALDQQRREQIHYMKKRLPLLVKLSPDLEDEELDDALDVTIQTGMDGVIASNTTVERAGLRSRLASQAGGVSGAPLRARSTQMVRAIHQRTGGALPIIGVGGVMAAADLQEKLDAGATLVQVYTGLVYSGPGLVKRLLSSV